MTTACTHDRVDFELGGIVVCSQCGKRSRAGDGLCWKCRRPLDDSPHLKAQACAA